MQTTLNDPGGGTMDRTGVPAGAEMAILHSLPRKLLLVDDEPDGAEFAAILFRLHGLQVTVVNSAADALQALQDDKGIDAVLSDLIMPDMGGSQLVGIIRERYPAMKIVMMSGHAAPDALKEMGQPCLFAAKPYRIDTILDLLRR